MAAAEYHECYTLLRRPSRGIEWDDMWGLLQQIPSRKKVTREQLSSWWGEEEMSEERFAYVMEQARKACSHGTTSDQIEKIQRCFLTEVFVSIDMNKDGRITRLELKNFLARLPIPNPVTEEEIDQMLRDSGVGESRGGMSKEDFWGLMQEFFLPDRQDIPLSVLVQAAREKDEERQALKSKTASYIGRLTGKVKETLQRKDKGPSSPSFNTSSRSFPTPKTPIMKTPTSIADTSLGESFPSDDEARRRMSPTRRSDEEGTGSPTSEQRLERTTGGVFQKLGLSFNRQQTAPEDKDKEKDKTRRWTLGRRSGSPQSSGSPKVADAEIDKLQAANIELRHAITRLKAQLQSKDHEVQHLGEKVTRLRKELKQLQSGSVTDQVLQQQAEEYEARHDKLTAAVRSIEERAILAEEELRRVKEERQHRLAKMREQEAELGHLRERVVVLEKDLENEREQRRELGNLRRAQAEDETRRKADLAKVKAELREKEVELVQTKEQLGKAELEVQMAQFRLPESPSGVGERFPLGASSEADSEGDENEEPQVVFLNPPHHIETVDSCNSTIFDSPRPIYYTFPGAMYPSQLQFDVCIGARSTVEYITCRDKERNRSFCAYIDQGCLMIPASDYSVELEVGVWHSISVTFSWKHQTFSLYIGSRCVALSRTFRDTKAHGIAAFDVYPRNSSTTIAYANIRFTTD